MASHASQSRFCNGLINVALPYWPVGVGTTAVPNCLAICLHNDEQYDRAFFAKLTVAQLAQAHILDETFHADSLGCCRWRMPHV